MHAGGAPDPISSQTASQSKGTFTLYVSVFLLLLAFFGLLNSLSSVEQQRLSGVVHGLEQAFGRVTPPPAEQRALTEALESAARAVDGIGELFSAEIPVAKIEASGPGRTLVVTLPARTLFLGDDAVRPETLGLLTRIADALAPRKGGAQVLLEFLVATADPPGEGDDAVPEARAAAFARALVGAGAAADPLTVGLERGQEGWARLLFTVAETVPAGGPDPVKGGAPR
jgi:hypothetical protein